MKDILVGLMVQMMPYMMPLMWVGTAAVAIGVAVLVLSLLIGGLRPVTGWAGRIAALAGLFFLACQVAGQMLDVPPSINFGDSKKFEFVLVPFWQIGLALLIPGLVLGRLGRWSR